jgi:hypothetical protein
VAVRKPKLGHNQAMSGLATYETRREVALAERLEILRKRAPANSVARSLAVMPASEGVE